MKYKIFFPNQPAKISNFLQNFEYNSMNFVSNFYKFSFHNTRLSFQLKAKIIQECEQKLVFNSESPLKVIKGIGYLVSSVKNNRKDIFELISVKVSLFLMDIMHQCLFQHLVLFQVKVGDKSSLIMYSRSENKKDFRLHRIVMGVRSAPPQFLHYGKKLCVSVTFTG